MEFWFSLLLSIIIVDQGYTNIYQLRHGPRTAQLVTLKDIVGNAA